MPPKIRELEAMLRAAGFERLEGKGSHRKWRHPKGVSLILSGKAGTDAKKYRERLVEEAIRKASS